MKNGRERPGIFYFECPYSKCGQTIEIYPVFGMHDKKRYEAWAIFWFEEGKPETELCKILYESEEWSPSGSAKRIVGEERNGWMAFWRFEDKKGSSITLDKQAIRIYGERRYA